MDTDAKYNDTDLCWGTLRRVDVYRIYLAIFTVLLGPFTFFDVQKTKYLQILTSLMRWIGESEKPPKCLPFSLAPPSTSAEKPGILPAGPWQWLSSLGLPGPLTFPEGEEERAPHHLLLLGKFSSKKT